MRILHLISHLSGGGAEQQLAYLAPELARMGHEVHIAYLRDGQYKPELTGVVLHQLEGQSNYNPAFLWQLVRLCGRIKPDIIHTWILQMDILGGLTARLTGVPWLFREPSSGMAYPSTWKHRLRIRIASGARAIVSNSRSGDGYWAAKLPVSRRYVVRNALPIDEIDKTLPELPPAVRNAEVPLVTYVGRLERMAKRPNIFLEALALVRRQKDVVATVSGSGPERTELEAMTRSLGLNGEVHFTGHLRPVEVWGLMKKAAVFVSVSAYEGCPNSVMEAMACGCPIVLSDIPAHREILDETCALFFNPSKVSETAETIVSALTAGGDSRVRAAIAKRRTRDWSIPAMARDYEKVYGEITYVGGSTNSVKKHFDIFSSKYRTNFSGGRSGTTFEFRRRLNLVEGIVQNASGRLLDCGCGSGEISVAALRVGAFSYATLTDISRAMLDFARANANALPFSGPITFAQSDIFEFQPASGELFDVVLCLGLIAHTGRLIPLLRHLESMLAPGGMIVLQSSVATHFGVRIVRAATRSRFSRRYGYEISYFTIADIESAARESGLEVQRVRRYRFGLPFGDSLFALGNYWLERLMQPVSAVAGSEVIAVLRRAPASSR